MDNEFKAINHLYKAIYERAIYKAVYEQNDKEDRFSNIEYLEDVRLIELYLKAISIIKEKRVNVDILLGAETVEQYNEQSTPTGYYFKEFNLDQEEFILLKELMQ